MGLFKSSRKVAEALSELATSTTYFPTFLAESFKFSVFLWYDLILRRTLFSFHLLSYFCRFSASDL
ncbi:hypothetical protein [Metallosphaera tengchongensis]|uniref:hypothetical protein n=1 Tax=Metallosphaera tengchongensis TaxID=1532350 RepID=UPI00157D0F22|nr:hypothetical protein [Metallosphaera tengchongensis]